MPEVIPIRPDNPEEGKIAYAINAIRNGELVAIPTDTLYSLVADPFNLSAVEKYSRRNAAPGVILCR